MSLKKLTDADKETILNLYRQTTETSSTLAQQYGVSSSTISRLLKASLSDREYEDLIHQKRLVRFHKTDSQLTMPLSPPEEEQELPPEVPEPPQPPTILGGRTRRRSSRKQSPTPEPPPSLPAAPTDAEPVVLPLPGACSPPPETRQAVPILASLPILKNVDLGAIVKDLDDDLEDGEDELDLLEEDLDGEEEEDWDESEQGNFVPTLKEEVSVQVLPLTAAVLPPTCYLVVDRLAELIVRPLREFAHLGMIDPQEVQQKTLPVFDNHRVARRFSHRSQRVIKVPDSSLLYKATPQLRDKGITRIFLDGRVYSLDPGE